MTVRKVHVDENLRLKELNEYQILNELFENEFEDIVELAAMILDTPVSMITFIDDKLQWNKVKVGVEQDTIPKEYAFCTTAIQNPNEVMVVGNLSTDERFIDNPLVANDPKVRFYAGAPLVTSNGYALGTLCVVDLKPREITEDQKKALALMSKKAIERIEAKKQLLQQEKLIENNAKLLKYLTDKAPGAIFQFERRKDGSTCFPFISKGIKDIYPEVHADLALDGGPLFSVIHPEDLMDVQNAMDISEKNLSTYDTKHRNVMADGTITWIRVLAFPEKKDNGSTIWYGTIHDITESKEYEQTLEDICFSISHVIRRPVTSLLGLVESLNKQELSEESLNEYAGYFSRVAEELDAYTKKLGKTYNKKREQQSNSKPT